MLVQLELSVELGFGFYWVRASFFFSSDYRVLGCLVWVGLGQDSGWDCARGIFPPEEYMYFSGLSHGPRLNFKNRGSIVAAFMQRETRILGAKVKERP